VQGVGFRPFVATLAARLGLRGWVRNALGVVEIHAEGPPDALDAFARALVHDAPPLAAIGDCMRTAAVLEHHTRFVIADSLVGVGSRPAVPPDVAMCDACATDVAMPGNRRFRYPFTTCTDCGPRVTVIRAMPYDRARTTLDAFPLCADCAREYASPADRRFHAESIACPACGPQVWLETVAPESSDGTRPTGAQPTGPRLAERYDAIRDAGRMLAAGAVLAIRGLGGFHLACDATSAAAVATLRQRKHREAKPLAVMVPSLEAAEALADLTAAERRLLASRERPIVLVEARAGAVAEGVAPGLARVGLMLAYTPLHALILEAAGRPLVMTSGNLSDEPIAAGLGDARARLRGLADAFLMHDREILVRVDDSVVRAAAAPRDDATAPPILLRRARGYAPLALALPHDATRPVLALGAHLKHTVALAAGRDCWLSPHVGDLETYETLAHASALRDHLATLLGITPAVIAGDLHTGYLSHRLGDPWPEAERVLVQHHHAHIAAVMGEHGETGPVLGVAYDGTGAGDDGTSWGAEFLLATQATYARVGHWLPMRLPGGDAASREGWRAAVGLAAALGDPALAGSIAAIEPNRIGQAERQIAAGINAPVATSMGRIFDAFAALCGGRTASQYEGQAAMELEAAATATWTMARESDATLVELGPDHADTPLVVSPAPLLRTLRRTTPWAEAAADLHRAVVAGTVLAVQRLAARHGVRTVALGGGTWQNALLLGAVRRSLSAEGFRVLMPRALPPNDGGIAYGQAVVAIARDSSGKTR
jgi:hydrogenase maturation protein HypF